MASFLIGSFVVAGCYSPTSGASPAAGSVTSLPSASASVVDPSPEPTLRPPSVPTVEPPAVPTVEPSAVPTELACPTGQPFTVVEFEEADYSCFGPEDVEIRGWVDEIRGIDFGEGAVEPKWLHDPAKPYRVLWGSRTTSEFECTGSGPCRWMFVMTPPDATVKFGGKDRYVIVTGHTMDPASVTCHSVTNDPTQAPEPVTQGGCELKFVMTGLRDAP